MGSPVTSGPDGRFQVDGVPANGGTLVVRRQFNSVTRRVVPSEKDETFVLAGPKPRTPRIAVTMPNLVIPSARSAWSCEA